MALGGDGSGPGWTVCGKELTDSVNTMAGTLTAQVRGSREVTTAVANGDLSRR
ncbi:histidine kinase OS=Streptomyces violarus OX=67380 GN=FHS41_002126 PE=4 SV=1 [Streptomyces violarus]